MELREKLANAPFEIEVIETWIAVGWLAPSARAVDGLSEVDLARARLIHDLQYNLGVNDEGVPIILDLVDQMHGLRRAMRELIGRQRAG